MFAWNEKAKNQFMRWVVMLDCRCHPSPEWKLYGNAVKCFPIEFGVWNATKALADSQPKYYISVSCSQWIKREGINQRPAQQLLSCYRFVSTCFHTQCEFLLQQFFSLFSFFSVSFSSRVFSCIIFSSVFRFSFYSHRFMICNVDDWQFCIEFITFFFVNRECYIFTPNLFSNECELHEFHVLRISNYTQEMRDRDRELRYSKKISASNSRMNGEPNERKI